MGKRYINIGNGLMSYFFPPDDPVNHLIRIINDGIIAGGNGRRLDERLLKAAQSHVNTERSSHDRLAYPLAQDFGYETFGDTQKRRVILVATGALLGQNTRPVRSSLGIDLGYDPWSIFQPRHSRETIDSIVTEESVRKFLDDNFDVLRQRNLLGFAIRESRFFYFGRGMVEEFERGGVVDMVSLIPLLTYTPNVFVHPVQVPEQEGYSKLLPVPFMSHRLKTSLVDKLEKRLSEGPSGKAGSPIYDWLGFRVVVENELEARRFEAKLRDASTIGRNGRTGIEHIRTHDYYAHPKENGYRALNIVMGVCTKDRKTKYRVIEVQVVDKNQYYRNEVNNRSPAFHEQQDKRKRLNKKQARALESYHRVLERVFGVDTRVVTPTGLTLKS
jgi:hypothetical protein